MSDKFYITTAIDYVNSLPHIGTAYEKITADCIARAKRRLGYDVRFTMGTDEHSINVKKKAIEAGLSPKEYCDRMAPQFEQIWDKLEISYNDFIRTTEQRHIVSVTELFKRINDAGDIYEDKYSGWYCEGCEAFIQEKDLEDGKCPTHMKEPTWIEETNYFFRLSTYGEPLLKHIKSNPGFIQPASRRNEIVRLIEGGLDDISVSRSGFDWGIPLPDDPGHVVYVWFDALINYISSLGFGGDDESLFDAYWPANLHVIGKDITRFHCVIWPAMLMSAGLPLPKAVFGHGFINHRGEKMSKSLGNVVRPLDIVDAYGADPLRYFLLRDVINGQDGDFTYERFIERYNSDLANDLGNLFSRTLSMIGRYFDGTIPESAELAEDGVSRLFPEVLARWTEAIEKYELSVAIDNAWELVREANRYIEVRAPWKLAKDEGKRDELANVLYDLACTIGGITLLIQPYMPKTADKLWHGLGFADDVSGVHLPDISCVPEVNRGVALNKPETLFPRIEPPKEEKAAKDAKEKTPAAEPVNEEEEYATIDDFIKLDLRIGLIEHAERVEKSKKLLRLKIDDGMGGRTILAGMAKHYAPEDLIGKKVTFIANLKPRKMMGEYSQGMVLAAGDDKNLAVLSPLLDVKPGSKVS